MHSEAIARGEVHLWSDAQLEQWTKTRVDKSKHIPYTESQAVQTGDIYVRMFVHSRSVGQILTYVSHLTANEAHRKRADPNQRTTAIEGSPRPHCYNKLALGTFMIAYVSRNWSNLHATDRRSHEPRAGCTSTGTGWRTMNITCANVE